MSSAKEPDLNHHPSDEDTVFSQKHSSTHPLAEYIPETPRSILISLPEPEPEGSYRRPERRSGRRRSSMSSNGLFKRRDEEDFMLMEVQVHTSSTFDNVSDEEDGNVALGLFDQDPDSQELLRRNSIASTKSLRSFASVGAKRSCSLPRNDFLTEEYQRTKVRFIESTLRSEQTRAIIQRQRSQMLLQSDIYPDDLALHSYQSPRLYAYQTNDGNLRRLLSSLQGGSTMPDI